MRLHIFNATRCLYDTARCHMTLPDVLWRCQMSIWRDRMSIWCCKMSKWRCKAKFLKAARILGCTAFCMYCQESRHVNNGSQHSSTRVTSNILFLGREVILPKDLFQAPPPPLGPDDSTPIEIIDQMSLQTQKYRIAGDNMGISWNIEPGDLVFAFSELRGDQAQHRKLRIKWSGPYIFFVR